MIISGKCHHGDKGMRSYQQYLDHMWQVSAVLSGNYQQYLDHMWQVSAVPSGNYQQYLDHMWQVSAVLSGNYQQYLDHMWQVSAVLSGNFQQYLDHVWQVSAVRSGNYQQYLDHMWQVSAVLSGNYQQYLDHMWQVSACSVEIFSSIWTMCGRLVPCAVEIISSIWTTCGRLVPCSVEIISSIWTTCGRLVPCSVEIISSIWTTCGRLVPCSVEIISSIWTTCGRLVPCSVEIISSIWTTCGRMCVLGVLILLYVLTWNSCYLEDCVWAMSKPWHRLWISLSFLHRQSLPKMAYPLAQNKLHHSFGSAEWCHDFVPRPIAPSSQTLQVPRLPRVLCCLFVICNVTASLPQNQDPPDKVMQFAKGYEDYLQCPLQVRYNHYYRCVTFDRDVTALNLVLLLSVFACGSSPVCIYFVSFYDNMLYGSYNSILHASILNIYLLFKAA